MCILISSDVICYAFVQLSWEKRLIDRVYNVYKGEKRKQREEDGDGSSPPRKRKKLLDRYPPLNPSEISDESTQERHMKALDQELKKEKPWVSALLELMELTFSHRREFVLTAASSVEEILSKYPALRKPDVVQYTPVIPCICT